MTLFDTLRAVVLFEISGVLVFSIAIIWVYIKRLSNQIDTNLTWHVISVATGFTIISGGVFCFIFVRIGQDLHPSFPAFLVGYTASFIGQYFLYRKQAQSFHGGK